MSGIEIRRDAYYRDYKIVATGMLNKNKVSEWSKVYDCVTPEMRANSKIESEHMLVTMKVTIRDKMDLKPQIVHRELYRADVISLQAFDNIMFLKTKANSYAYNMANILNITNYN
jgi:hypothetical protein